jgi:hypothetical protein
MRVHFFPTASPAPVVSVGFDHGNSNRDISVVLICTSFMARDGESFLRCVFAI